MTSYGKHHDDFRNQTVQHIVLIRPSRIEKHDSPTGTPCPPRSRIELWGWLGQPTRIMRSPGPRAKDLTQSRPMQWLEGRGGWCARPAGRQPEATP